MDELIHTRVRTIVRKELLDNAVSFASDSLLQHRNIYEGNVTRSLTASFEKEGFTLNNIAILKMQL